MLSNARRHLWELARCARHNLLHLRQFKVSYRGGLWQVRHGKVELVFPYYPYLDFHDVEGYLREGGWKIEPGMTVLDAGGCRGEFSLFASKCVGPGGKVVMLEPDPANVEFARRNFELNGSPGNIEIVRAGLWKERGKLRFQTGQGAESRLVGGADQADAGESTEIEVESLPSLADRLGLSRLDFVKMDIEGAEVEAIASAAQLPPQYRPRYAVASYHIVNGRRTADDLTRTFVEMGYHSETGNPRHLTTWAWPVNG